MAGVSGDGSYHNLIANIYGMNKTEERLKIEYYSENGNNINLDDMLERIPFSIFPMGLYDNGFMISRTVQGLFAGKRASNDKRNYGINTYREVLYLQTKGSKDYGISVRWGDK